MPCQEIHQKLAVYRELNKAEQDRIQEHLKGCASCAEALAAYQAQDQLLSSLPVLSPTPELTRAIRGRTVQPRHAPRPFLSRWAPAALSLLLFVSVIGGTVAAAADTLPGDILYPLKKGTEQLRLALTFNQAARHRYEQALTEARREEAREVIRLRRQVHIEFQGKFVAIQNEVWLVDTLAVAVSPEAWAIAPPPTGSMLLVEAYAIDGELQARRIRVLPPAVPTPYADAETPAPGSPTRTGTCTATPQHTCTPSPQRTCTATPQRIQTGQPTTSPSPTRPIPRPSLTTSITPPPGPGPQPSATPDAGDPSPQPSATPGAWGPGEQPSATPGLWGPSPQLSATPRPSAPGPR